MTNRRAYIAVETHRGTSPIRLRTLCSVGIFSLACLVQGAVHAQLRIVSYNTLDNPRNATDDGYFNTIFDAISTKDTNGIAKRVDVMTVQEQTTFSGTSTAERMADLLNTLHGVTSYEADLTGTGGDLVGIVYDSSTVSLEENVNVFTTTRLTYRAKFQPIGYTSSDAAFYVYSSHFKAGSSASDISTRETEGLILKNNANALPQGTNIIYTGDFNFGDSLEIGYLRLLTSGNGQGFDPIDLSSWPGALQAEHMTQSTRTVAFGGGASGGMDDRFDLQIMTGELLDGEGVSYLGPTSTGLGALSHSYQAFGNDGTSWNQDIKTPTTGRSQPASVLDALHEFSDHLPVVADLQLPSVMDASLLAPAPSMVDLNDIVSVDALVENIADVLAAAGADELDYTLNVSGDLTGGGVIDSTLALSGGNTHEVFLDTSSLGLKSGTITVASSSLAVENSLFEFDIDYEVLVGFLEADFNEDTFVNALDLAQWEGDFGLNGDSDANGDGESNGADFLIWQQQNGLSSLMASSAVPEPSSAAILLSLAVTLLPWLRTNRGI